jgi:hypothetical protein
METTLTLALVLIGAGAVVAGAVAHLLPAGERLAATVLALVIGAGAGVVALAIGWNRAYADRPEAYERSFLVAAAIGLAAVIVSLRASWRRRVPPTQEQPPDEPSAGERPPSG